MAQSAEFFGAHFVEGIMAIRIGDVIDDRLRGTSGLDYLFGLDGDDWLSGGNGSDRLYGDVGDDSLYGGGGNDRLFGGEGDDVLRGGAGRDLLVGGLGKDLLIGGAGPDTFRFGMHDAGDLYGGEADSIADFGADDTIDLRGAGIRYVTDAGADPGRGALSIWSGDGNTYLSWNTGGAIHDLELTGFTGDPYSQIVWYDDDFTASVATTGVLAVGTPATGAIEVVGDEDWFAIDLEVGQLYTFDLSGAPSGDGTLANPWLALYDSGGQYLLDVDNSTDSLEPRLSFAPDVSGTYYVSSYGGHGTGTYTLEATSQPYVDDFPANDTTTGVVAPGGTATGEIGISGDADWFKLAVTEGETYTIEIRGVDGGGGTLADPFMNLYTAAGDYLGFSDDGNGTRDAQYVYTATETADIYIEATSYDPGTGTYEVAVALGDTTLIL